MIKFCENGCGREINSGSSCKICKSKFKKKKPDFTPLDKLEQIETNGI